jgi:hypothetical protein
MEIIKEKINPVKKLTPEELITCIDYALEASYKCVLFYKRADNKFKEIEARNIFQRYMYQKKLIEEKITQGDNYKLT